VPLPGWGTTAGVRSASDRSHSRTDSRHVHVLGSETSKANVQLVGVWRELGLAAELMSATGALARFEDDDIVVARIDVRQTLDGVEPGLFAVLRLERRGARVFNTAESLLAAHDKLRTARLLGRVGIPHPPTFVLRHPEIPSELQLPAVVKPRFGGWGKDVFRCETRAAFGACIDTIKDRAWFQRHGAIVQELVPSAGRDLRVLIAGGRVVGAAGRVAAPGEWRTNVSLGGTLEPAQPSDDAAELAATAAAVIDADFVGVDLMPVGSGEHVVLELNGAVDFDETYALGDRSVFADVAAGLGLISDRP
jgi:[lysine-biosynthesis-protein LysW]--L-2-aminoadipate ligase